MAWSTPRDWTAGEVLSAANMDTYVSDNLAHLYSVRFGAGRRNILTNSHFDIWQSGTSFTPASSTKTYTADQWCAYRVGTTGVTVSRQTGPTGQAYAMRVQRDSGNSSTTAIQTIQAVETADSLQLAGATTCQLKLTLKAGADFSPAASNVTVKVSTGTGTDQDPTASWAGAADALSTSQAITTSAVTYDFNDIEIAAGAKQVKVQVLFTPTGTASTNDWFEISGAQLTLGGSPSMERLPISQTLSECKRYYQTGSFRWEGYATNGTVFAHCFSWPVEFRTTPTLVQTNSANTSFTATVAGTTLTAIFVRAIRTANATANGIWAENYTASARL